MPKKRIHGKPFLPSPTVRILQQSELLSNRIIEQYELAQGWNDNSVIALLCQFIDERKLFSELDFFLKKIAQEENAENEFREEQQD